MKVRGFGAALAKAESKHAADLDSCTRCGEPWGFEIIERVEIWKCGQCGYEARERSREYLRMMEAQQKLMAE